MSEARRTLVSLLSSLGTVANDVIVDEALVRMVDHVLPAKALKVGV